MMAPVASFFSNPVSPYTVIASTNCCALSWGPRLFSWPSPYVCICTGAAAGGEFYRTTIRAVKCGCLFIVMPFLLFFIFEIAMKVRIHEIQYLLVGLALSLFFHPQH